MRCRLLVRPELYRFETLYDDVKSRYSESVGAPISKVGVI